MAKKTQNTTAPVEPTVEPKVVIAMVEDTIVTGTLVIHSVDADAAETKTLTVVKGKSEKGSNLYQVFADGKSGKMVGTLSAAINSLLKDALLVLPAAWVVPNNEKEVKFPEKGDNKAPDPKEISDLASDRQDALRYAATTLQDGVGALKGAERATRSAVRTFAVNLRQFRSDFNKSEWAIFCKLPAPMSDLGKLLSPTNKNAVSEFVGVAGVPDSLFDLVPEGKNSPKAILAWVNGLRGDIALAIVETIKGSEELSQTGFSAAVHQLITEHFDAIGDGSPSPLGVNSVEAQTLLSIHSDNVNGEERLFDLDAKTGMIPRKVDGVNVTKAVFGTDDRADELVAALCRVYNGYKDAATKAVVSDMKAKTADLVKNATAFGSWSADEVARHLFNILSGRIDETSEETLVDAIEFADIVVDKMAGWLTAIGEGSMTVADVLATDVPVAAKPATEGDAEEDADATA